MLFSIRCCVPVMKMCILYGFTQVFKHMVEYPEIMQAKNDKTVMKFCIIIREGIIIGEMILNTWKRPSCKQQSTYYKRSVKGSIKIIHVVESTCGIFPLFSLMAFTLLILPSLLSLRMYSTAAPNQLEIRLARRVITLIPTTCYYIQP